MDPEYPHKTVSYSLPFLGQLMETRGADHVASGLHIARASLPVSNLRVASQQGHRKL